MNLNRALSDIAQIRAQLDRSEAYAGFRSLTVGLSAIFVIIGASVGQAWIGESTADTNGFLTVWVSVAVLSAIVCSIEMLVRNRISNSPLTERLHRSLIWQTTPALLVGCIVTVAIVRSESENFSAVGLLPGIWAMIYGLGLWACGSNLPKLAHVATLYFLLAGGIVLLGSSMTEASTDWSSFQALPSFQRWPNWQMVVLFGTGQLMLSGILFWKFERGDQTGAAS